MAHQFKVGDTATRVLHSDCHAGRVIKVTAKSVTWQRDKATLISPPPTEYPGGFAAHFDGEQEYAYEPDPQGQILVFRLRKDGKYHSTGSGRLIPGSHEYYDRNF